jgi:hypothetical protein
MSMLFTLMTFSWFILENYFRNRNHLPLILTYWVRFCRGFEKRIEQIVFLFKRKKSVENSESENTSVEIIVKPLAADAEV